MMKVVCCNIGAQKLTLSSLQKATESESNEELALTDLETREGSY